MQRISNNTLEQVKEFHKKFNCPIKETPDISDIRLNHLRISLLREEVEELRQALNNGNIVEVLDALIDIQYVLDGAFLSFGLHSVKDVAFREVHESNMSKLGLDGEPIYREDGKVLKGPHYFQANLGQFFPGNGR